MKQPTKKDLEITSEVSQDNKSTETVPVEVTTENKSEIAEVKPKSIRKPRATATKTAPKTATQKIVKPEEAKILVETVVPAEVITDEVIAETAEESKSKKDKSDKKKAKKMKEKEKEKKAKLKVKAKKKAKKEKDKKQKAKDKAKASAKAKKEKAKKQKAKDKAKAKKKAKKKAKAKKKSKAKSKKK